MNIDAQDNQDGTPLFEKLTPAMIRCSVTDAHEITGYPTAADIHAIRPA